MASAPPLTLRNLTSTSIELKLLERFEAPGSLDSKFGIANITKNITTIVNQSSNSSAPQLAANAQPFSHQDVNIRSDVFQTTKTDIAMTEKSPVEVLRLTFENDGERHRLDLPPASIASTELIPLTPNPRFHYTAVFLPQFSHLSLFSSANLSSWMQELRDDTPLSALSIPGTHNSPTHHRALPSVRCQAVSPREQLDNGVRFFDIRVQPETPEDPTKDGLLLVHSVFPISLTGNKYFRDLVNDVFAFLDAHPSETVVMSVKREGTGNATDAQLSRVLRDHYAGDVNHWFTAPRIPTLGESRHKIVLIRRFALEHNLNKEWDGAGWCIDASTWADNTPNATCPSGDVCVQDFYEVMDTENIDKKLQFAEAHLERAASCVCALPGAGLAAQSAPDQPPPPPPPKQPFFINFLSASNFWKVGCWPEKIAAKLNPAVVDFLCRRHNETEGIGGFDGGQGRREVGDGSTGIVVCDWVGAGGDWDLVRCIVGMNAKLENRERGV